ncbi:MAG: SDR family NAD(P)-dependent oxidoreductase [Anaerolineae bacterium]|nr:SDR family NAD(P)-dependent oxidoreductase [Anaerolineae bacterium]
MTSKWTSESIPDLTGKNAVVTGASSGIGYETARALARKGARVVLACRSKDKGEAAVRQITQEYPEAIARFMLLDLADLASVRRFANEFAQHHDTLDILINNAGIMKTPFGKTADGFELQLGTNHLGHFALTGLVSGLLVRTPLARVVMVSSWGHQVGVIDFDNLNAEKGYDAGRAYSQSKLANLLFAYELQRRFVSAGRDTIAAAAHPGWTKTNLAVHWPMVRTLNPFIGQEPEMGAWPTLYAATAAGVQGGDYYGPSSWGGLRGYPTRVRSSDRSYDTAVAFRLWTVSEELTGVHYVWDVAR